MILNHREITESNKLYLKELEMELRSWEHVTGDIHQCTIKEEEAPLTNATETTKTREFFNMRRVTASVIMSVDNSLKHLVETFRMLACFRTPSWSLIVIMEDTIYTWASR